MTTAYVTDEQITSFPVHATVEGLSAAGLDVSNDDWDAETDFNRLAQEVYVARITRLSPLLWWQKWLLPALGPLLCLAGLATVPIVVSASSADFLVGDFFSSSTAALLTIAGIVPAAIGLTIVGRPSLRIDHSNVVLRWGPLVNAALWAIAWFATSLLSLLALIGVWGREGEQLKMPGAIVLTMSLIVVVWAFLLVANFMLRLTSRVSSIFSVPAALEDRGIGVIKDLRDVAMIEARTGDRRAVRDRMFALCEVALQSPLTEDVGAALEELGFLGAEMILDRDQALDAVHLIFRVANDRNTREIHEIVTKELSALWSSSILEGGSPKIGLHCSYALRLTAVAAGQESFERAIHRVLAAVRYDGRRSWTYQEREIVWDLSRVVECRPDWAPSTYVDALVALGDMGMPILGLLIEKIYVKSQVNGNATVEQPLVEAVARIVMASSSLERPLVWSPGAAAMRGFVLHGHLNLALDVAFSVLMSKSVDAELADPRRGLLLSYVLTVCFGHKETSLLQKVPGRVIPDRYMDAAHPAMLERIDIMASKVAAGIRRHSGAVPAEDSTVSAALPDGSLLTTQTDDLQTTESVGDLDDRARFTFRMARTFWAYGWSSGQYDVMGAALRAIRRMTSASLVSSACENVIDQATRMAASYVQEAYIRADEDESESGASGGARLALASWPILLHFGGRFSLAWAAVIGCARELNSEDVPLSLRTPEARSDLAVRLATILLESDQWGRDEPLAEFIGEPLGWFSRFGLSIEDGVDGVYWLFLRLVVEDQDEVTAIHAAVVKRLMEFPHEEQMGLSLALARLFSAASVVHDDNDDLKFAEINFRLLGMGLRRGAVPSQAQWQPLCDLVSDHSAFLSRQSKATQRTAKTEAQILGALARFLARGISHGLPFDSAIRTVSVPAVTDPSTQAQDSAVALLKAMIANDPEHLDSLAGDLNSMMNAHGVGLRRLPIDIRIQVAVRIALALRTRNESTSSLTQSTVALAALAVGVVMEVEASEKIKRMPEGPTRNSFQFLSDLCEKLRRRSSKMDDGVWWRSVIAQTKVVSRSSSRR